MRFNQILQTAVLLATIFVIHHVSYAATTINNEGQLVMEDMQHQKHTLAQYKGKWLVVNYWATWCPPCLEEMPELTAFYDARKKYDVMVLGIALDYESPEKVAQFADDMLVSYPIILGNEAIEKVIGAGEVLPTTFIYNPHGKLVKIKRGVVTRVYLERLIKRMSVKR